jgi:hypothetical protein
MNTIRPFNLKNGVLIILSIVPAVLLTLFLTGSKAPEDVSEQRNSFPNQTISVPIPASVNFCDLNIYLDRLDMRERFDREINSFTYFHSSTLMYIKKANRYFPIIEPILQKNNIPNDFKYLCAIESGLDTRALSSAKAAGLWQFMEGTGREFGLEIRDEVDERYHIEKATEAACRYLRDAYYRYGDWVNVAASYNAGIARISSEMQKQQVENAFDLLLVSETSRYVFRLLAIKEIFQNPQKYGFFLKKENLYPAVGVDYVEVSSGIFSLASFAKQYGINYMILKEYNVWLRDTKITIPRDGKTYWIAIPRQNDLYFNANRINVHDRAWIID